MDRRQCWRLRMIGWLLASLGFPAAAGGQILDPNSFTSLGSLNPSAGVTIDTSALTLTVSGGPTFTGVVGPNDIAVFTFTNINIGSGLTVSASGSRPLALLSQGNIVVAGTINASAQALSSVGGPGGGNGGAPGSPGSGPGGGQGNANSAGGGGFGGAGGNAASGASGGSAYGDLLAKFEGGSGGGGTTSGVPRLGGGGGGAMQLVATGSVTASGTLSANGSFTSLVSGGGSGGAILLAGATVAMTGSQAARGATSGTGGGGGGGHLLLAPTTLSAGALPNFAGMDFSGASGGTGGQPGVAQVRAGTTTVATGQTLDLNNDGSGGPVFSGSSSGPVRFLTDAYQLTGGTVNLAANVSQTVQTLNGTAGSTIALQANAAFAAAAGGYSGAVNGANASLSKVGTGTLQLFGGGSLNVSQANITGGTLQVSNGGTVTATTIALQPLGTLFLDGGRINADTFNINGTLQWARGTVNYQTATTLSNSFLNTLLGTGRVLVSDQILSGVSFDKTGTLTLDGGMLTTTQQLNNGNTLLSQGGTLTIGTDYVNQAGVITRLEGLSTLTAAGQVTNHGSWQMANGAATVETPTFVNQATGLLTGSGRINGQVQNQGTLRVNSGEELVLEGPTHTNPGSVQLVGGTLTVEGRLENLATGAISGRGTFAGSAHAPGGLGLVSSGAITLSAGFTDIFGDVELLAGSASRVGVGAGAVVTFYDDVIHNADEFLLQGSGRAVFFGSLTGAGGFQGSTGNVELFGDYRPGNSPASVTFEGSLLLQSSTDLFIEIGGNVPGTQFDQLIVEGGLNLAGTLQIQRLGGFVPTHGQVFRLIDKVSPGLANGTFAGLNEGSLFSGDGVLWQISYRGGDGNDVVLIAAVPEPSSLTLASLGLGGWLRLRRRQSRHAAGDAANTTHEMKHRSAGQPGKRPRPRFSLTLRRRCGRDAA